MKILRPAVLLLAGCLAAANLFSAAAPALIQGEFDKLAQKAMAKIEKGQTEANRKNGTVTLYDPTGKAVCKYMFRKGWPCKFKGPTLDATKNEIAIEELEIAHEGLERQQ